MTRRLLFGAGAALLLVIVAAAWLLSDATRLKTTIEELVTVASERTLRINGDFSVTLGRVVSVHATDIEWQNPAWSSKPHMLKLRELDVSVDLWSLIEKPVLITSVQASDGELFFEWTEKEFNWAIEPKDSTAITPGNPLPLLLDQADLENVDLHFSHPGLTEELTIELQQVRQQQDASGNLVLDIDSVFDGRAVNIAGRVGTFPQLTVAGDIDYDLAITGPNATITASGAFSNLAGLQGPELDFRLAAPDAAVLLDILNLPAITHGPADLSASIDSDGERLAATARGTVGGFKIQASGKVDRPGTLEGLEFQVATSGPDAGVLARLAGIDGFPDRSYTLRAKVSTAPQGLVIEGIDYAMQGLELSAGGTIGGFPELRDFDVQLSLAGENLADFNGLAADLQMPELPYSIDGSMRDTVADKNDDLDATIRLGQLIATIKGNVTQDPGFTGSTFDYVVRAENLQQVSALAGVKLTRPLELKADGSAQLEKNGITVPRFNATLGPYVLNAEGGFPVRDSSGNIKLAFRLQGDDFSALANLIDTGMTLRAPPLPFDMAASILADDGQVIPESGSLRLGRSRLALKSIIVTGAGSPQISADLHASGASLAELLQGQGLEGVPDDAFELNSKIQVSRSSGIQVSSLEFSLPGARLRGNLSSDWPGRPGDIKFALSASGNDLKAALPEIPDYTAQAVPFNIQLNGEYSGEKIRIDTGNARIGSADVSLGGLLRVAPKPGVQGMHIDASGSSLADLGAVRGYSLPGLPFQLSTDMDGTENSIKTDNLSLEVGASNLHGELDFNWTDRPVINADLRSSHLSLNDFNRPPDGTENVTPAKPSSRDRLLPADPLPLAWLNDFDGNVRLEATEVVSLNRTLHDLLVDASLSNGELVSKQVEFRTRDGNLNAQIHLRPVLGKTAVSVKLSATDVIIALRKMSKTEYEKLPRRRIDAALTATGNSMAELGASLDGFAWMRSRGGQYPRNQLGALMGDFLSGLFVKINPFVKELDYIAADCEGVYLEAEKGKITTAPIAVFLTKQVLMGISGNIDLATEKVDLEVESNPAEGIGISASELVHTFTRIGGTLSEPNLVLDAKGAAIKGGAAIATGGLSLLAKGLWTRWVGTRDICQRTEQEARKIRQQRDPDNVPD